jgi:hypothetical protein
MATLTSDRVAALVTELDDLAVQAADVAGAQAAANLSNDGSVTYWSGAAMAYRKAAKIVREAAK